ncbi:uncharacterized protein LOC111399599 [Olea europaea var. sylvestris]|uniref:uncharacterized protein LOC111399599 n=1 Tax=Olea europaea var. sylvestris TaxID=158386 RepID=UPI000C1D461A|nr:uncharacterized protein LOC111399599 [Olea europaea var. sylvestris]
MGKAEDEQPLPSTTLNTQSATPNAGNSNGCCLGCSRLLRKVVTFRCIFVLVLGVAVLLSAVFWLPFLRLGGEKHLDLDYPGHDIVASFMIKKPSSFLDNYVIQLENDIFALISFPTTKVEIIKFTPAGSNTTNVVFAVESDVTTRSLIRASFVSMVIHPSYLHLTPSLFGDPFSFEVLKFKGGITASPNQKAFLLQKVQIRFNFTLNFSIDELLNNFYELTSQLKSGLHLATYENLYLSLTNLKGSTMVPPTTVDTQVVLAVGLNPSKSRLKQLAKTITNSHTKNLGLNNTVFGRVKQVRLSSMSINVTSPSPSPSPSPYPLPPSHHHHHHHHRHHHDPSRAPGISPAPSTGESGPVTGKESPEPAPVPAPAPALAPGKSQVAKPPGCHFGYKNRFPRKPNEGYHMRPTASPVYAPSVTPSQSPQQFDPPIPDVPPVPATSPSSNVAYNHNNPPSKSDHAGPPDELPLVSPALSPSSAGTFSSSLWAFPLFLLFTHLWQQRM